MPTPVSHRPKGEHGAAPRREARRTGADTAVVAAVRQLGSQVGNAALSATLAPHVQRLGGGNRSLARSMLARPQPVEVKNLTVVLDLFGRLAGRRLATWARGLLMDQEESIEAATYLGDPSARADRLHWALSKVHGDSVGLRGLLAVLLDRPDFDQVKWAWGLTGGDIDVAEQVLAYMEGFQTAGGHVVALAKQAVEDSGGDVKAATAEMVSLAKYDHNPGLRTWAASRAAVLGDEEVEDRKQAATRAHDEAVAGLGPDTPYEAGNKKLAGWKDKENKEKAAANKVAKSSFALTKDKAIAAADLARPGLITGKQTAMEDFLQDCRAAKLAPSDSEWLLKSTEGRTDLAAELRLLFGPGIGDPRAAAIWVLGLAGKKPPVAQRLAAGLLEALAAGLDLTGAERIVGLNGWLKLDPGATKALAAAIGASLGQLDRAVAWLSSVSDLAGAVSALTRWTAKAGALGELLDFVATKPDLGMVTWFVDRIGATASKGALCSLATLRIHGVADSELGKLLAKASPAEAEILLHKITPEKGKIDPQLLALLPKATAAQLTSWIVTHNHGVHNLHKWVVDQKLAAADIDQLATWAPPNILPFLLENDTPATLIALMGYTPNQLFDLKQLAMLEKSVAMYKPSLAIVAEANTVKAAWDKGTFNDPLHSVVYHYCKHVRDEGRAETVTQYSASALALWANYSHTAFAWNSGWKIQRIPPGHPAGTYATSGQPYSFWY